MILTVRRRTTGSRDSHGNATVTYATGTDWAVRGMAPGAFNEDGSQNRDRLEVVWTVFADKAADAPGALDRVEVLGNTFEVNGEPQDWTLGPWEHPTAGLVVELKRMEG